MLPWPPLPPLLCQRLGHWDSGWLIRTRACRWAPAAAAAAAAVAVGARLSVLLAGEQLPGHKRM